MLQLVHTSSRLFCGVGQLMTGTFTNRIEHMTYRTKVAFAPRSKYVGHVHGKGGKTWKGPSACVLVTKHHHTLSQTQYWLHQLWLHLVAAASGSIQSLAETGHEHTPSMTAMSQNQFIRMRPRLQNNGNNTGILTLYT